MKEGLAILPAEEKFRKPIPRIAEGRMLAKSGAVTSCMDISDGLSSSLYELMRASGNGFEVESSAIPLHESLKEIDVDETERVNVSLNSGDEYELLFTVQQDSIMSLREIYRKEISRGFFEIGHVTSSRKIVLSKGQRKEDLRDLGYEHFR